MLPGEQLLAALEAGESGNSSVAYEHYLLAITQDQSGQTDEARTSLSKAIEHADAGLGNSRSWDSRLTLELLRQEAESLIGAKGENICGARAASILQDFVVSVAKSPRSTHTICEC